MKLHQILLGVLLGLALVGCKSNDDFIASKDRELQEREEASEALRKRLADAESVRVVMEKELNRKQGDADRINAENARLQKENLDLREKLSAAPAPAAPDSVIRPAEGLEVVRSENGIILRLDDRVTFSSGSATLSKSGQKLLAGAVAEYLKDNAGHQVSVEGHTDDVPIKKSRWKSNLNLSIARALAVRGFLRTRLGVTNDRLRLVAYGEGRPLVKAKTQKARARNRRVEIVLYSSDS